MTKDKKTTHHPDKQQLHPDHNEAIFDPTPLLKQVQDLSKELEEKEEIAKRSQLDYLNLKTDFDILQRHTQQKIASAEKDATLKEVKSLLPFIEDMRKSLLNLNDEQKKSPMGQGLQITYSNFLKSLEKLHIKPIEAVGLVPDANYHEPISTQTIDQKKLKGKIIHEFEQGFLYHHGDEEIVLQASKVIVGI